MVAISDYHQRLVAPYRRASKAVEVIRSAKNLAKLILMSDDLIPEHKTKILSDILWFLSEADGKYSTRFRSKIVVDLANADPKSHERIQHEHVYPRKTVSHELLDNLNFYRTNHDALELFLDETVGCIVTEEEHKSLRKDKVGWSRYENVPVYDMSASPPELLVIIVD
jgi:hypothetical protein